MSKGEGMKTETELFISALTQKVHLTRDCSVTRRNHAVNLSTSSSASELAQIGYVGCKRCGAYDVLTGVDDRFPVDNGMKTGDIVTFAPRAGESAEGIVTRVWDKPAADPYVTVRTTEDEGRTFTRCSSAVVRI